MKVTIYNHYIAIDLSIENMAIARMTEKTNKINLIDVPSDIVEMKVYLKKLKGSKILVVEETMPIRLAQVYLIPQDLYVLRASNRATNFEPFRSSDTLQVAGVGGTIMEKTPKLQQSPKVI